MEIMSVLLLMMKVKVMMMMMMMMMKTSAAADEQNFCSNSTVLRTRTSCHSCSITLLIGCRSGFKQTPRSLAQDCSYYIRTASLKLPISGCSFECYKEVELKSCCRGYWGPDCLECPEQAERPCNNRGQCSDGLGGTGVCTCQDGFAGTACEQCAPGRYGATCSSVCTCVHGLCDQGLKGSGRCTCFSGYKGPSCDQELPECASLKCQQNSRCMEEALTGRLECQCSPGHQRAAEQCVSINPCVTQPGPCHARASCVHTGPDQHLCACDQGWSGDGRVCQTVDPCQSGRGGCAADSAHCVYDGPGKSHCECLPMFDNLSSGSCSMRDLCRPDSCHKNANCSTVAPGTVECTCLPGYHGNGKVCYGNIIERLRELNTQPGPWLGQLSSALSLFGLVSWPLQNLGPFTIFVPTNRGFRGYLVKSLLSDPQAEYLCKLHLLPGSISFSSLKMTDNFFTLTGKSGEVDTSEGDTLTKVRLHGSRKKSVILQSDLTASNGMIHIVNKLMDGVTPTVESEPQKNIMTILSGYGKFDKFRSLLEKTGLAAILDLPGPFTIFAPTSSAFDTMTDGHLTYLSSSEGHHKLVELLRNHIVESTSLSVYNAAPSIRLTTMANQVLTMKVTGNGLRQVNEASVLEAAVEAKNGRLYVLDQVLTPASIQPVLPHRCDITENKVIRGECVSCSKVKLSQCSSGVFTGSSIFGCIYRMSFQGVYVTMPSTGCWPLCNATVTTPACCKGFYGPECGLCPGGYETPCSGHGQCMEGMAGNGSCVCDVNFRGFSCQYCSSPNKFGPKCDTTCHCVHGVCDNRPEATGRCKKDSCVSGFTGPLCDRQTMPCGAEAQFCHAHADCDFSQGTTRCVCKPGYQGDGITCVESDPCAPPLRGGCSLNAKCIKTGPGTRTCQCLTGWQEDGDDCRPINNCDGPDAGGCHPNATCINVGPGQSDCSCKHGYKGDGRNCDAVNQCVTVEGGCHYLASCLLVASQWTCVCDDGYIGDGRICYGSVEQELMALSDAADFFRWSTDSGLSLSDQNITLLVPSSAAVGGMSADDRKFWTMKGNVPTLVRNHIIPGNFPSTVLSTTSSVTSLLKTTLPVSSANEVTTVGGATITTANLAATNGLIHVIDKVLVPDRKLSEGLLATLALQPQFSLFRSYLIEYNLTDEIEQNDQFTVFAPTDDAVNAFLKKMAATALDVNTTRYHVVAAERLLKTDLQPGGYKQTMLGFSFQLAIASRDGKLFVNDAQINTSNILSGSGVIHGLTSVLHIQKNRCDLTTFLRVQAPCVDCLFPSGKICPNDSVPDRTARTRKCMFTRTFEGERLLTVGCRATCQQKNIEPACCGGYFGKHCEPCPGPKAQPCFGNGACVDGTNGTGACQCHPGFNGTACETCQSGKYGVHCDQSCVCKNGNCNDGVTGDGTCECDVGWRGVICDEKIMSSADELCGSVKCHTSANCVIGQSGPRCLCASGFQGNGTSCQAKDPCVENRGGCSEFAVCKRTSPGHRVCVCNSGYYGDGLVCLEINPCLVGNGGCHDNAECIHVGPNKTSCSCTDGYTGDGQNCHVINQCLRTHGGCHQYATCNMSAPGVRSCTCRTHFVGDGLTCKGSVAKEILLRKLRDFYLGLMMSDISLKGRGPFTVFPPKNGVQTGQMRAVTSAKQTEHFASAIRSHIVMCHTLLPSDLSQPRNLTSLSGLVLTTRVDQGNLFINGANVTFSDIPSTNGIFHEIDKMLDLPDKEVDTNVNLTDVAKQHGYTTFFNLLQDTGVMEAVNDLMYRPLTLFLPSDDIMASLPQQQRDFLFHPDNRPQLVEYLKYHILINQKVYAEHLVYLDPARTLQGSPLAFTCGGRDAIGEIFVNDGKCRIVQRHLVFNGGIAYGIDCLLTPPSLGGRCDEQSTFELRMSCGVCSSSATRCPKGSVQKEIHKCDLPTVFVAKNAGCLSVCTVNFWQPKCCRGYHGRDCLVCPGGVGAVCSRHGKCDDGHLGNGTCTCDPGFSGAACDRCSSGFFGPTCKACNCSHGSCDDGREGSGACRCEEGWVGPRCDTSGTAPACSPPCSPQAVCTANNTCVCRLFYEGDGFTCTAMDMCGYWNGGCAKGAKCSQTGEAVTCTCPKGHTGDGFTCQPDDPCAAGDNGGCHEHATCTMTGPGKKKCVCKDNYVGDGLTCEVKQLPISRCLQGNGQCHTDAQCTDLHFEDAMLGVFHLRADRGQYKLNFSEAQLLCAEVGGALATYAQLSYAQEGGLNMCAAGWLAETRVAYPTTYSNPKCGFGHVGIVDYGVRKNLSETWDVFCYRMKEVRCECRAGYVGDGFSCTGNLLQVLTATPTFSNFLTQILNYSQASSAGKHFVQRLSNLTVQSTLFVPDNSGFPDNQTLSPRDMEFHLSEGRAFPLSQLKNGSRIRTRVGSLTVLGVTNLLDASALSSCYINDRFVTNSDVLASNGIIHVLQGALQAPPPRPEMHAAHKAGMGVGVILLVAMVTASLFVGYNFYKNNSKGFRFHYFKEDEEEESEQETAPPADHTHNICNPVYDMEPESKVTATEAEGGGVSYDLIQGD